MSTIITTADELAQRAMDLNVISQAELQGVWSELGTHDVELELFEKALLRRNVLTTYQLDRLQKGLRSGFFYGEYKVQYCIGAGTFARVFRAEHVETGEIFAIKVLRSRFSVDSSQVDTFRREGELGKTLQHPNITPTYKIQTASNAHFFVMEFVEGQNLREFYKVRRIFEPLEAARIVSGIVAGLNYAFQKGITHRDLKMSNVLVSSEGIAKLVDFGLAGLEIEDELGEDGNARTIDYAGLERATKVDRDDTRSDIFFVGSMFYQMLAGKPALAETRDRVQRLAKGRYQDIKPILEVKSDVPMPLAMVVNKALEFDPSKRYQTPGEMLLDIKIAVKRIQEGNVNSNQTKLASREGIGPDGAPRRLMVIESDTKMQDIFRDLFKRNGYRVLVSSDPERAVKRFYTEPSTAEVVLFSTGMIGTPAVEAFNAFGKETATKSIPSILLLGERQAAWERSASVEKHRLVAKMPIKLRQLRQVVLQTIREGEAL